MKDERKHIFSVLKARRVNIMRPYSKEMKTLSMIHDFLKWVRDREWGRFLRPLGQTSDFITTTERGNESLGNGVPQLPSQKLMRILAMGLCIIRSWKGSERDVWIEEVGNTWQIFIYYLNKSIIDCFKWNKHNHNASYDRQNMKPERSGVRMMR